MFFSDEGGFGTKTPTGRCWAEKGEPPITYVKPAYKNFYTYAGVSPFTGGVSSISPGGKHRDAEPIPGEVFSIVSRGEYITDYGLCGLAQVKQVKSAPKC